MMAWLNLLISTLALARSQDYSNVQNPDIIHFFDGVIPAVPYRKPQVNLVQQNIEVPLRLPANLIPQGPSPNRIVNTLIVPSPNLETPYYSNSGDAQQAVHPQPTDRFAEVPNYDQDNRQIQTASVPNPPLPPPDKASVGLTNFGINFMKIIQKHPDNVIISPYSIGTLLALLQQGAFGISQQQITNALQMTPAEAALGVKKMTENLQKRESVNIFKVGNGLFLAEGFSLNPSFKQIAIQDFNSEVMPVKFSRPEQAAAKINNWVAKKTNDKITNFIKAEALSHNTQLVLVNAVYFKGLWKYKMARSRTGPGDFHLSTGEKKTVQYMRARPELKYHFDGTSQVIVLPFEGDQYSLVIILPTENASTRTVLESLTPEKLLSYQKMDTEEIILTLPKFTIKTDFNIAPILQQLGIQNIFSPASDLSGLGNFREFAPQVSSADHSALLSIDEDGATATAASAMAAVALSYTEMEIVMVNRPFVAVLWDSQTSVPLFMAKIEDPIQQ